MMAVNDLNEFVSSKKSKQQKLHQLNYFRSKKQFEQYKNFYRRKPKQRNFRNDQRNPQPRFSDTFSYFKKDNNLNEKLNKYSMSYLHTPGITFGIRPGLGKPIHICDCSQPVKSASSNHYIASNSVLTALVSIQYLTLMCTTYCHQKLKQRNKNAKQSQAIGNWKPSYIPFKEQNTIKFRDTSNFSSNNNNETKKETMFFASETKQPTHHFKYKKYENVTSFTRTTIRTDTYSTGTNLPPKISITTPPNLESPMSSVEFPQVVTVPNNLNYQISSNVPFELQEKNKPLSKVANLAFDLSIINKTNLNRNKEYNDDDDRNPLEDKETFSHHFNLLGHKSTPQDFEMLKNDAKGKTYFFIIITILKESIIK